MKKDTSKFAKWSKLGLPGGPTVAFLYGAVHLYKQYIK